MSFLSISAQTRSALSARRLGGAEAHFEWRWEHVAEQAQQYIDSQEPITLERLRVGAANVEPLKKIVTYIFSRAPEIRVVSLKQVEPYIAAANVPLQGRIYHLDVQQDELGLQVQMQPYLGCQLLLQTKPRYALMRAVPEIIDGVRMHNKTVWDAPAREAGKSGFDLRSKYRRERALALAAGIANPRPFDLSLAALRAIHDTSERRHELVAVSAVCQVMQLAWPELIGNRRVAFEALKEAVRKKYLIEEKKRFKNEFHPNVKFSPEGVMYFARFME